MKTVDLKTVKLAKTENKQETRFERNYAISRAAANKGMACAGPTDCGPGDGSCAGAGDDGGGGDGGLPSTCPGDLTPRCGSSCEPVSVERL